MMMNSAEITDFEMFWHLKLAIAVYNNLGM